MSTRAAQLHAARVRRREAEQVKIEKSAAVNKYFDKWGKITSRFESWTAPEYYKEAEENLEKQKADLVKDEKLSTRREKLRDMFETEQTEFEREIKEKSRPRSRMHSADVLEQIKLSKLETEETKRRQELEKELYQKFRFGVDRDQIMLQSKSENHALAKLNWLDRQVEMQIQNDRDKKEGQERELRIQEEARKHEAFVTRCKEIRESEIKELRSLQETHLNELRERETENEDLRLEEVRLRTRKNEVNQEIESLRANTNIRRDRAIAIHNYRRIKMILRERSEQVRRDLKQDLAVLNKIGLEWADPKAIRYLMEKFQLQMDLELQKQSYIEAMYESEAKHNLTKQERIWDDEATLREQQIRTLLDDCAAELDKKLSACMQRQEALLSTRETHLTAIENANSRLQALMSEKLDVSHEVLDAPRMVETKFSRPSTSLSHNRIIQQDVEDLNYGFRRLNTGSPCTVPLTVPQFGRKKIAWS